MGRSSARLSTAIHSPRGSHAREKREAIFAMCSRLDRVVRFSPAFGAVLAGVLALAPRGHAEEAPRSETQALRVHYTARAGCGSRASFVAELEARTPRVRVVDTEDAVATVSVELLERPTGIVGELSLREANGMETVRAVAGKSCEEVVPALALIAAVLVDPQAMTRPPPTPAPTPAPGAVSTSPAEPPPPAAARPPHDDERLRLRPAVGTGVAMTSTVAPNPSFAPALELGLELERAGERGPMLLLSLERFASSTVTTDAGLADFSTLLARLSLCPLRWPARGLAFLAPCGAFEAGSLHVDVSQTLDKQEPSVLWLAAGPGLHLELRPLRVLGLELDLLGVFPLVRGDFYFSPQFAVFSIPVVGWTGRVGVKAVWP